MQKSTVEIAMALDKNYVYPCLVSMTSIMENTNSDIHFYLLISEKLEESDKQILLSLTEKYDNCSIQFFSIGNEYDHYFTWGHVTKAIYFRIDIPDLLNDVAKCIYLDCDTVIRRDISELYNIDIGDNVLAGTLEPGVMFWVDDDYVNKADVDIKKYINSGVLIMDLKELRRQNFKSQMIHYLEDKEKQNIELLFGDQDAINAVCRDKIYILHNRFNAEIATESYFLENPGLFNGRIYNPRDYVGSMWDEAIENPFILHFAAGCKPWKDKTIPFANEWWDYARKTNYINEITLYSEKSK